MIPKKKTFANYPLSIEIINNLLTVRQKDFNINVSAGEFHSLDQLPTTSAIGQAVYKTLILVLDEMNRGGQPLIQPKTKTTHLSMKEAAFVLKVSISTLRRMIDEGLIESSKTKGGQRKPISESVYSYKTKSDVVR